MEELIRTPFVREVAAICVDPSPTRPPLPPWLKSVPTLAILGEASPRIGPGPVNNWLFERRMGGSAAASTTPRNTVMTAPVYNVGAVARPDTTSRVSAPTGRGEMSISNNGKLPPAMSATGEGDKHASPPVLAGSTDDSKVEPYFNLEMSGKSWSDIYSFLAQKAEESTKAYNPILRNFELLSALVGGGGGEGAGGGGGGGPKVSEKEAALLREFEAYTASRDAGVAKPIMRKG
jgi:hypothetical protein